MLEEDEFTSYRGLVKSRGEKDPYGEDVYRNLEKIDKELVPQGPISQRDDAPHDDALWYVTGEGGGDAGLTRYDGDAGQWRREERFGIHNAQHYPGGSGGEQIQNAIDALPAGGTVYIPPDGPDGGEWIVDNVVAVPSNTHVVGVPGATVLRSQGDHNSLQVRGTDTTDRAQNVVVEGLVCELENTTSRLQVTHAEGVTVRNCQFYNGKYGVNVARSKNVLVEDCIGEGADDDGFTATDLNAGEAITEHVWFRNITVRNYDQTGIEVDDGPQYVYMIDCVAEGGRIGFRTHTHVDAAEGAPENVYYIRCHARDPSHYGFTCGANREEDPREYHFRDITCRGAGESAFATTDHESGGNERTVSHVTIEGFDFVHDGNRPAIGLDTHAPAQHWRIANGSIRPESGSSAISTRGGDVLDLNIQNVDIYGGGFPLYGIEISARDGGKTRSVTVDNCAVYRCRANGIDARAFDNAFSGVKITNNEVYENGQDATKADLNRSGIRMNQGSGATIDPRRCQIRGNHCFDTQSTTTQQYGIYRGGLVDSIVSMNVLRGNAIANLGGSAGTGVDNFNVT